MPDRFTISAVLSIEAIGLAGRAEVRIISCREHRLNGAVPFNTTGGLIGWGHPTGARSARP
jgi:acetyl-CoA C-acetyltransferase/acetyl-CoA acyltransferase